MIFYARNHADMAGNFWCECEMIHDEWARCVHDAEQPDHAPCDGVVPSLFCVGSFRPCAAHDRHGGTHEDLSGLHPFAGL